MTRIQRAVAVAAAVGGLAWASAASAQLRFTRLNTDPAAANAAFPLQNLSGPSGTNYQVVYPYPGQCLAGSAHRALFPTLPLCDLPGLDQLQVRGRRGREPALRGRLGRLRRAVGVPVQDPRAHRSKYSDAKFQWEVLNPPDYTPDKHEVPGRRLLRDRPARGQRLPGIASAGLFPESARQPSGTERHAVDRTHLQQARRLLLSARRERELPRHLLHQFRRQDSAGRTALHADLGRRADQQGGGPVTQVLSNIGTCSERPLHGRGRAGTLGSCHRARLATPSLRRAPPRPGQPTTTSPPGPRSASAGPRERRSS